MRQVRCPRLQQGDHCKPQVRSHCEGVVVISPGDMFLGRYLVVASGVGEFVCDKNGFGHKEEGIVALIDGRLEFIVDRSGNEWVKVPHGRQLLCPEMAHPSRRHPDASLRVWEHWHALRTPNLWSSTIARYIAKERQQ